MYIYKTGLSIFARTVICYFILDAPVAVHCGTSCHAGVESASAQYSGRLKCDLEIVQG